jgi:hypothetical protein
LHRNQNIEFDINIKDFLSDIGANEKNYKHLIDSIEVMQSNLLRWKEGDEIITTAIVVKSKHNPRTGKVKILVDNDIARKILEVKEQSNFHFLKSNIFRLQNAQAIKLYPFFKSWLNHGHYSTELERFKKQFGYDTKGYTRFNKVATYILEPAIKEINEKTDIHVSYEPTGENLDGTRPRISGLKFRIYKREDIKLLPNTSPTPNEPHYTDPDQPGLFDQEEQTNELAKLLSKITIQDKPAPIVAQSLITSLINEIGYQATKDGLLGMIDSKAQPKTIAFFTPGNLKKYPGYEQAKQDQQDKKNHSKAREQEQIKKQRTIDELKDIYNKQRSEYLKKVYAELDPVARDQHLQELWDSSTAKIVFFRNNDKSNPNNFAIEHIAKIVAFPNGYDEKKHLKSFALNNYDLQIEFNESGDIVFN